MFQKETFASTEKVCFYLPVSSLPGRSTKSESAAEPVERPAKRLKVEERSVTQEEISKVSHPILV